MSIRRILALAVVVLLLNAYAAQAQEIGSRNPQSAIPTELIVGTLGGAALGVGGALLFWAVCAEEKQGWEVLACLGAAALGYLVGVPVGSTLGVNVAGSLSGVQGNLLLSILGAAGGEAVGLGLASLIANTLGEGTAPGLFLLVVVPFFSSAGATLGYNVGAQMTPTSATAELFTSKESYLFTP